MQVQVQEYKVDVKYDPYWRAQIEALVKAGFPRTACEVGCAKTEAERSAKRGYA